MTQSTSRVKFDIDPTYKLEYGITSGQQRFQLNQVGPCEYIDLYNTADLVGTPSGKWFDTSTGSDSTGDGTFANPYETALKAANETTSTYPHAIALNETDLDLSGLTAGLTSADFQGVMQYNSSTGQYICYALPFTPTDLNSVFVQSGGSSGDGTYASPKTTIVGARAVCNGTKKYIVILNSATYTTPGITFDSDCEGIYAWPGQTPTLVITQDAANTTATATPSGEAITSAVTTTESTCILANGHVVTAYLKSNDNIYLKITSMDGGTVYTDETNIEDTVYPIGTVASGTVASVNVARVSDTQFVMAWVTGDGTFAYPYRGYFQIYTEDTADPYDLAPMFKYTVGAAKPKAFYSGSGTYGTQLSTCACYCNSLGNILIVYEKTSNAVCYQVRDNAGSTVKAHTDASMYHKYGVGVLSDDSFVLAGHSGASGGDIYKMGFMVLDENGETSIAYTHITDDANTQGLGVAVFDDDDFAIIYSDSSNSDRLAWSVYNSSGVYLTDAVSETDNAYLGFNPVQVINGDCAVVTYYNDDDNAINAAFFGVDGTNYADNVVIATSKSGSTYVPSIGVSDSGIHYILYNDTNGYLVPATLDIDLYWDGLIATSTGALYGVTLDGADQAYLYRLINASAPFTRKWCEVKGASYTNTHQGVFGLALQATDTVTLTNNKVHDNSGGDYVTTDTATITDNDYYRQTTGYCACVNGSSTGIVVTHNTMVDSVGALRLQNNNGSEVVNSNIMFDNDTQDINADTTIAVTYGIMTGESTNVTEGVKILDASPLFLNDGSEDPADTDHTLMIEDLGDYADSPALRLGGYTDTLRDLGPYDVRVMDCGSTATSITIGKSPKCISVRYEYVGKNVAQMMDGAYRSDFDAMSEVITFDHDGVSNSEFDDLFNALISNGTIRFYGNPTTEASTYIDCVVLFENITGSANTYRLNQTGKQKIKYALGRKLVL